jgi:hypothetical protein
VPRQVSLLGISLTAGSAQMTKSGYFSSDMS